MPARGCDHTPCWAKALPATTVLAVASAAGCNRGSISDLSLGGGSHNVVVQWHASPTSGVTGYNVYRGATSGGPYTRLNSSVIASLSYTDRNVQAGQTYYYVVTAIGSDGFSESVYSQEARVTVPLP
jgi:fibronectin type 3 domain-containing protein